ncbi:MAG: type II toxin-antitoxin system VapC family toxin [Rhodopseudomonas palustris]|uniref:Type II toxin-antitoxin system VapC family toxin n=1 Tax=Rhodopseudomonas palustris TaxID=1076 RepID=A0A933RZR9_RHOPL|nr:type II toxin-antitoxin system VapC family toxin [Rhodopseudomonas palustris]
MQQSSNLVVYDASAVLAVLLKESGHQALQDVDVLVLLSAVNLAEVRSRLWDKGLSGGALDEMLARIEMSIVAFDAEQARLAAELRPATRAFGLSLGDRACLALGVLKNAAVYTADRVWAELKLPIEVRVIR